MHAGVGAAVRREEGPEDGPRERQPEGRVHKHSTGERLEGIAKRLADGVGEGGKEGRRREEEEAVEPSRGHGMEKKETEKFVW